MVTLFLADNFSGFNIRKFIGQAMASNLYGLGHFFAPKESTLEFPLTENRRFIDLALDLIRQTPSQIDCS